MKKGKALGQGVDALFSNGFGEPEKPKEQKEQPKAQPKGVNVVLPETKISEPAMEPRKEVAKESLRTVFYEPSITALNSEAIAEAVEGANKRAMITIWSPMGKAVLMCLKMTIPGYSISDEAGLILEEAVTRKYPTISAAAKPGLTGRKKSRIRPVGIVPDGIEVKEDIVRSALDGVRDVYVLSIWSPVSTAVLRYLRMTTPLYSISKDSRELIEQALQEKYPALWRAVEVEMARL